MTDQFIDMLEGVQRPQVARLQAENARLREQLRIAEDALGTIVHHEDTGGACEAEGCRHITNLGTLAEDALIRMSVVE
jgi:hypothetical protein